MWNHQSEIRAIVLLILDIKNLKKHKFYVDSRIRSEKENSRIGFKYLRICGWLHPKQQYTYMWSLILLDPLEFDNLM